MMPAIRIAGASPRQLIERLPAVRGRYRENVPLAPITWFQVGGPAEVLFRPADAEDLAAFLAARPADVPVTVIGVASNLLVRDGGVPGVVVRLGRGFAGIALEGETLCVGAGALDGNVALAARNAGLSGLEFLSGIPGTIGGAVRMNAGAYGCEIKDVLVSARVVDAGGRWAELTTDALGFGYRSCSLSENAVVVSARLRALPDAKSTIDARMAEIGRARETSQPIRARTGGSTFANPDGGRAWELIERAGCRGLVRGDAQVSERHCNFLINRGAATAADLEGLGEEVRHRVLEATGVRLRWEIRRIGVPAGGPVAGGGTT
jgi:UDP-N-acetylmuramate dehydrogenase